MTADLVAFLRERLTEDEQAAQRASGNNWLADGGDTPAEAWLLNEDMHLAEADPATVDHIARHDPARVLAEVDAKRRILGQYEASLEQSKRFRQRAASAVESDAQELQRSTENIRLLVLLGLVKLLSLPYREHPDYRPEWAPDGG